MEKPTENNIEIINKKYLEIATKVKIDLEIINTNTKEKFYEILQENNKDIIKIDKTKVQDEYEVFLSYCVRMIILPKLRLETQHLIIRRFTYEDSIPCFEFLSDKDTCLLDDGTKPFEKMDEEYASLMEVYKNDKTRYIIELKSEKKAIGIINLIDKNDRAVVCMEIGYIISPNYRRKGYAYEAISYLSNYLQKDLHLDLIIARTLDFNHNSIKLLNKLGFTLEGRRHKDFYYEGIGAIDMIYYYRDR